MAVGRFTRRRSLTQNEKKFGGISQHELVRAAWSRESSDPGGISAARIAAFICCADARLQASPQ